MSEKSFEPIIDQYTHNRGGDAKIHTLLCFMCNEPLATYQKDGPGPLKRIYLDRIHEPTELKTAKTIDDMQNLHCRQCRELLGTPMVYARLFGEQRLAYRLYASAVKTEPPIEE
ncbi:MAG: hypothetical protein JWM56_1429 [Candidatus Peribacteria bacterium]|nr:hypothetical protein [Candidatus Peribacteria bacterium]